MHSQEFASFIHEAGALKTLSRSGWASVGITNAEHVADHMYRSMLIGYGLAEMEGVDSRKVALMLLFHDLHESRLGDAHTLHRHYVDQKPAEMAVARDQVKRMPANMGREYLSLFKEFEERKTKESIVAKDAESLDCAFQAIEYRGQAGEPVEDWVESVKPALKTESARKLLASALDGKLLTWWRGFEVRK